ERARLELLPALDIGLLVHDRVPLIEVWDQRLREGGTALFRHRAPRSIAQPVVRKALGDLGPISQRSVAPHMVPQATRLEERLSTAVLFEEIEGVWLEKDQACDTGNKKGGGFQRDRATEGVAHQVQRSP